MIESVSAAPWRMLVRARPLGHHGSAVMFQRLEPWVPFVMPPWSCALSARCPRGSAWSLWAQVAGFAAVTTSLRRAR